MLFQVPEEVGEEKLALEEDENTKINMDHYYPDDYDQYAEGMTCNFLFYHNYFLSSIFKQNYAIKSS